MQIRNLHLEQEAPDWTEVMLREVCRFDLQMPGCALFDCGSSLTSLGFRRGLVRWVRQLDQCLQGTLGYRILPHATMRFDQQLTTMPHFDSAPPSSLLLLAYEPSPVASIVTLFDPHLCVSTLGMSMDELRRALHYKELPEASWGPYIRARTSWSSSQFGIALVNNSTGDSPFLGVMHKATVPQRNPEAKRIVNSMMLRLGPLDDEPLLSFEAMEAFAENPTEEGLG